LRRFETANAAPGHGVLIGGGIAIHAAVAGAWVEIGKERGDAWRTGEQPRDISIGARAILLLERDVAVGVDEGGGLCLAEEREPERDVQLNAVVVGKREAVAECGPQPTVDATNVIAAGAVTSEAQAKVSQIVRVWRFDQVAIVLHDRDLADVDGLASAGTRDWTIDPVRA
jgi:hypothetical protein